jgi:hypothetical protein
MSKRKKALPEEEEEVNLGYHLRDRDADEAKAPEATVSVETRIAETSSAGVTTKHCVFCNAKSTDFTQPGKDLRGKWICPECVVLV